MKVRLVFLLLFVTVSAETDLNRLADPLYNIVERSRYEEFDDGISYNIAGGDKKKGDEGLRADEDEYRIPYEEGIEYFKGIKSPSCGWEIEQLDVSKIKKPHQIRLSFTGDPTEMAITWTTNGVTEHEQVNYGPVKSDLNYTSTSISHQYSWHWDEESKEWYYTSGFIHEALMINLIPGMIHYYQIESNGEESEVLQFVAAPESGSKTPLSFMHVGDVGTFGTSVMVTNDMMERMKEQQFHGMIHCGDISYANKYNHSRPDNAEQKVWDTWGQMVQPIGSKMAYMAVPGNHELDIWDSTNENGTIYAKRFIMPGNERYYSFGVGMVHFVAVSTDESIDASSTQGQWFKNVLTKVNQNRDKWPWLVVFQHRPIYNSNNKHKNWEGREGNTSSRYVNPEIIGWVDNYPTLLVEQNVDLVLNGHVHHYERTWPMKNVKTWDTSYTNVKYPVHITCGHSGKSLYKFYDLDKDGTYEDSYFNSTPGWSASRDNSHWGHCELDFINETAVEHRMYRMKEGEHTEKITITRSTDRWSAATALTLSTVLALLSVVRAVW